MRVFSEDDKSSLEELTHYGIKGMKWGVRKDDGGVYRSETSEINVEPGFHKNTKAAALEVAGLMRDRYGYNIKNIKVLDERHPEFQPEYLAFVEDKKLAGGNEGTIFVRPHNMTAVLKDAESDGWNAPGTGNTRGLLTHESAHSLFHSDQVVTSKLFGGQKITGGSIKARDKALRAAQKVAKQDGLTVWHSSGYARSAAVREELEAELFSQYHWATDPPRFVNEWGKTLHKELGVDPTPFKEVK